MLLDTEVFCGNEWNWGLLEFSKALGWDPRTDHTRERFEQFRQAARLLRVFDRGTLEKLSTRPADRVAGGPLAGTIHE